MPTDALSPPVTEDPKVLLTWMVYVLLAGLLGMWYRSERLRDKCDAFLSALKDSHKDELSALHDSWKTDRDAQFMRWSKVREEDVQFRERVTTVLAQISQGMKP